MVGEAISAVLLDAFGTLVAMEAPGPLLRSELQRLAGVEVTEEQAAAAFRAEIDYYREHHLQGRDPESLERLRDRCAAVIAEALPAPTADLEAVREAMLRSIRFDAYPEVAAALQELRGRGLRLVVASNWDCSLPEVLERVGLGRLVDAVVSSAEAGAAKPDPGLFEAALTAAGSEPREAVHVGDDPDADVAGARAAGLRAVLVARRGDPSRSVDAIHGLDELASLIFRRP
jgi:putative hydrolase of the HAD superfamily